MVKTFISYPGNKTRVLKQLLPLVPKEYDMYYEPMVGSGALFLALQPKKAVINDINKDVVNIWKNVKKDPKKIIDTFKKLLKVLKSKKSSDTLEWARKIFTNLDKYEDRHIYFLFFLELSYSFLFSYKEKYYFYGFDKRKINKIKVEKRFSHLEKVKEILKNTRIYNKDYKTILRDIKKGDFVYLDPPYIYDTKNPVVYNKLGEQNILNELKEQIDFLTQKGAYVMLSNSDFEIVRDTFKEYTINTIKVYRPFKRIYENELVIRNYS